MAKTPFRWTAAGVLALALTSAALANFSETTILQPNSTLSVDTGAVASSGGDILWSGSNLIPQGAARVKDLGVVGLTAFGILPQAYFVDEARSAQAAPISGASLAPGDGLVVVSNSGAVAKVLVTANGGGFLSLRFTTFGLDAPAGVPRITQIVNNSSFIPPGYPNYGIPPSSLFVVVGSGLADPGGPILQSSAAPGIPLTLNGASMTVVVNGVTTHPALYYTSPTQVAAVLPAATPVGTGTVTLTYRGVSSAPAPIEVTPSAVGINSYSGSQGVVTDAATGALLTYTNSGEPGQAVVIWSTGLGANPDDSDTTFTTTPHAVNTPLQIYIGGVLATILFQGSSGYPAVNQINVVIPASVPTGCWVPLAAITGNVLSNIVTIPINRGGGACTDPQTGISGNQASPPGGQAIRTGLVSLVRTDEPVRGGGRRVTEAANGAFVRYTGLYVPERALSPGGCILQDIAPVPFPGITPLHVGSIMLTGPGGLSVRLGPETGIRGSFSRQLPAGSIPATGGTFTFQGLGGTDVGPFTTSLTLTNPLLGWTNQGAAASIDRAQGLLVTWTGGNPGTYVFVTGTSSSTGLGLVRGFTCMALADAGRFTVPSYILLGLPAGNGAAGLQNDVYGSISATGLDISLTLAGIFYTVDSTYR